MRKTVPSHRSQYVMHVVSNTPRHSVSRIVALGYRLMASVQIWCCLPPPSKGKVGYHGWHGSVPCCTFLSFQLGSTPAGCHQSFAFPHTISHTAVGMFANPDTHQLSHCSGLNASDWSGMVTGEPRMSICKHQLRSSARSEVIKLGKSDVHRG